MPLSHFVPDPVEEMIHGVVVRDRYRWLEDRSLPETEEWIREQRKRHDAYFADCGDLEMIRNRVRNYLDVEVVDQPARAGNRYFFRRRNRGQEQGCLYVRDTSTNEERLLVDPSKRGPYAAVAIHRISGDGTLLAYELRQGGEDKKAIHIVDVDTSTTLVDSIERGYARGFVFHPDNRGFYYCQETLKGANDHGIHLHLFRESMKDQVIFRVARSRGSRLVLTADSVHLGAVWIHESDRELVEDLWIARQDDPATWRPVFCDRKIPFSPILKHGRLFAVSYEDALNGKLVELNRNGEELGTIVHDQGSIPRQLVLVDDKVFINYVDGLNSFTRCWSLQGDELPGIELPATGTATLLPDFGDESAVFLSYESFTQPPTIFEYLPESSNLKPWHEGVMCGSLAPAVVRSTTYCSIDGAEIPITLVSHGSLDEGTPATVLMTSYGGFGVSATPQFSVLVSALMECGAIFALPHIRGGGEFGKAWHDGGRGRKRQNSFEDFLGAAEWLCSEGITTPRKLAIFGGSNSGLLVAAAMTQRPDLFRAVLCIAPLLDMVRYECFDQAAKWREEYGTCDDEEDFHALYAYSPYHRVVDGVDYPATLFVSGDKDDRCNPAHVRKMAARLMDRSPQSNPVLVDYSRERGHSPALPLNVRIDALARRIAFLCRELGLRFADGGSHDTACA